MKQFDNHISMAGLHTARVAGRYPSFAKVAPAEGVVIAVRYKDDDRNRSKMYVEYDVRDLRTGQVYPNCRRLHQASGQDDGDDNILRPAQKVDEPNTGFQFDPMVAPLTQSDGDRVIIEFVNGAHHSPVIMGVLPHRRTSYGADRVNGRRRFTQHKGTSFETQDDGTYVITRNVTADKKTTFVLRPNGDIEIDLPNGARLHLANNQVLLDGEEVDGIRLGFDAIEKAVLGTSFRELFNALIAAFNALKSAFEGHKHIDGSGLVTSEQTGTPIPNPAFPGVPPLPPGPTNPQFFPSPVSPTAAGNEMPEDHLSERVRVQR